MGIRAFDSLGSGPSAEDIAVAVGAQAACAAAITAANLPTAAQVATAVDAALAGDFAAVPAAVAAAVPDTSDITSAINTRLPELTLLDDFAGAESSAQIVAGVVGKRIEVWAFSVYSPAHNDFSFQSGFEIFLFSGSMAAGASIVMPPGTSAMFATLSGEGLVLNTAGAEGVGWSLHYRLVDA